MIATHLLERSGPFLQADEFKRLTAASFQPKGICACQEALVLWLATSWSRLLFWKVGTGWLFVTQLGVPE